MRVDDKFTWNTGDFTVTPPKDISKAQLRVIHFSSNTDLPSGVRSKIPDAVGQTLFRQSFNNNVTSGKSEMLSYAHAYKALSDAGYKQNADQQWMQASQGGGPAGVNIDIAVDKSSPTVQQVHVNRPLGSDEDDEEKKKDDPGTQDTDPPAIMYYADPPTIQNSKDYRNENDDENLYPNHMQRKDDPGTQDVDPPYQDYASVPNYIAALPADRGMGTPGLVEKRISGSSQIPLNSKGEALAAKLGVCIADKGGLDVLYCSTLARGKETAHEVAEACVHTVLAKPTDELVPWKLGDMEGKSGSDVKDLIKYYIEHPDERPAGKGADGKPAETFNEAVHRQLGFWKKIYEDFEADPTLKIGVICHGRGLDLLIAWIEEGCPDDFDLSDKELFNPKDVDHASMMRWHKDDIDEVDLDDDDPLKPGVYPIIHSLTDDDTDDGNKDLKKGGPGSGPHPGQGWINPESGKYTKSAPGEEHSDTANRMGLGSQKQALNGGFIRYMNDKAETNDSRSFGFEFKALPQTVNTVKSNLKSLDPDAKVYADVHTGSHVTGTPNVSFEGTPRQVYAKLNSIGKSEVYLPPVEVHKAAQSAYDVGTSIVDITSKLAEGEGITESQVREIAKYFKSISDSGLTVSQTTLNAWGGFYAEKWVKRVLKKITAEHVERYPAWIGVDLDNTLAQRLDDYGKDNTKIGPPIEGPFFDAVKAAVKAGKPIRIFTARVAHDPEGNCRAAVQTWCKEYLGKELPVTAEKDPGLREFWDDKAHNPEDFKKSATRCMVCFDIPREIADQVQVPGGEDPSDMHVTLAYLGKEVPIANLDKLKKTVSSYASKFAPIKGTLSGPTRFHATTQSDGKDVCTALFSSVSMQDFRKGLVKTLEKAGFPVANNFSYTPHVTLKYIDQKDELPVQRIDPADVVFNHVSVWYGGDVNSFPLSGTLIAKRLITGTIVEAMFVDNSLDGENSPTVWAHVSCFDGNQYGVFFDPKGKHVQLGDELSWESLNPQTCILGSLSDGIISPGLPFFRLGALTEKEPLNAEDWPIVGLNHNDPNQRTALTGEISKRVTISKETGSKQGSWVTVNGQHILIGADGKPVGGNPRVFGRSVSAKVDRARKNAVLTGKHEQDIADRVEAKVSKALGVPRTENNSAFDLRNDDIGIEVKTMVTGKNDKITMGKTALGRKVAEAQAEGIKTYTVVADMRGRSSAKYYFSDRLGSLRLGTMTPMTLSEIKERIKA